MHVVINSNTYKIRIPVVYSLVVYFLHVEIHSMKLKKIYSFAHCLELIKMDLLEKGSADVLYASYILCKYTVILHQLFYQFFKKLLHKKWEIIPRFKICSICTSKFMFIFFLRCKHTSVKILYVKLQQTCYST